MLFLLNDSVLDIGEPSATFCAARETPRRAKVSHAVRVAQQIVYEQGGFAQTTPDVLRAIAAEIACASVANAALFLRPVGATAAQAVNVRLAEAPLTTLAFLLQQQMVHGPNFALCTLHIWKWAARPAA